MVKSIQKNIIPKSVILSAQPYADIPNTKASVVITVKEDLVFVTDSGDNTTTGSPEITHIYYEKF